MWKGIVAGRLDSEYGAMFVNTFAHVCVADRNANDLTLESFCNLVNYSAALYVGYHGARPFFEEHRKDEPCGLFRRHLPTQIVNKNRSVAVSVIGYADICLAGNDCCTESFKLVC